MYLKRLLLAFLYVMFFIFAIYFLFQQIGVIGAYSISIAVVIITLVATVFTTDEEPGKDQLEPVGMFSLFIVNT